MPRTARLKIKGADAYYHVISRSVHKQFLLGDEEKEKLVSLIKRYQELYFVKTIGYCIMSNHFHLLLKISTGEELSDSDIQTRVEKFYGQPLYKIGKPVEHFRAKLSDVSEYVKQVKQSFSCWYNRQNDLAGTFWAERFKSGIVEEGNALLTVLSYIDLNPVRAGIVKKPEHYRFSSIGYRYGTGDEDDALSFDGIGLIVDNNIEKERQTAAYLKMLYSYGFIGKDTNSKDTFTLTKRLRYLSEGVAIGSKGFIDKIYSMFGGRLIKKKERKAHKTGISNMYSIRRLRE
jgi:REP element-mobilizing transposase RayT